MTFTSCCCSCDCCLLWKRGFYKCSWGCLSVDLEIGRVWAWSWPNNLMGSFQVVSFPGGGGRGRGSQAGEGAVCAEVAGVEGQGAESGHTPARQWGPSPPAEGPGFHGHPHVLAKRTPTQPAAKNQPCGHRSMVSDPEQRLWAGPVALLRQRMSDDK